MMITTTMMTGAKTRTMPMVLIRIVPINPATSKEISTKAANSEQIKIVLIVKVTSMKAKIEAIKIKKKETMEMMTPAVAMRLPPFSLIFDKPIKEKISPRIGPTT